MSKTRNSAKYRVEHLNELTQSLVNKYLEKYIPDAYKVASEANDVAAGFRYIDRWVKYLDTTYAGYFFYRGLLARPYWMVGNLIHLTSLTHNIIVALEKLEKHKKQYKRDMIRSIEEVNKFRELYELYSDKINDELLILINYLHDTTVYDCLPVKQICNVKMAEQLLDHVDGNPIIGADDLYQYNYNVYSLGKDTLGLHKTSLINFNAMIKSMILDDKELNFFTLLNDANKNSTRKKLVLTERFTKQSYAFFSNVEHVNKRNTELQQSLVIAEEEVKTSQALLEFKDQQLKRSLRNISFINSQSTNAEKAAVDSDLDALHAKVAGSSKRG